MSNSFNREWAKRKNNIHINNKAYRSAIREGSKYINEFTKSLILRVSNPKIKKVETIKEALARGVVIEKVDSVDHSRPTNKVGDRIGLTRSKSWQQNWAASLTEKSRTWYGKY